MQKRRAYIISSCFPPRHGYNVSKSKIFSISVAILANSAFLVLDLQALKISLYHLYVIAVTQVFPSFFLSNSFRSAS